MTGKIFRKIVTLFHLAKVVLDKKLTKVKLSEYANRGPVSKNIKDLGLKAIVKYHNQPNIKTIQKARNSNNVLCLSLKKLYNCLSMFFRSSVFLGGPTKAFYYVSLLIYLLTYLLGASGQYWAWSTVMSWALEIKSNNGFKQACHILLFNH